MSVLKGHALKGEGEPHDGFGARINLHWGGTAGVGRAKCECGEMSGDLPSSPQRKAWHRQHKDFIRGEAR